MTIRFGANGGFKGYSSSDKNGATYFGAIGGSQGGRYGDLFYNRNAGVSGFIIKNHNGNAAFFGRNGGLTGYTAGGLYFDRNGRCTGWKL